MKLSHICFLALTLTASPAWSLIIAGPNGTGTGNSTQASLNAYTSANSLPAFPYWNNVIGVSDASGIYLGAVGSYGWVLTAAHVTQLTPGVSQITVNGTNYTVRQNVPVGTRDLRLYRIGGESGDPALPSIPNVTCAITTPALGTQILNFGRGARVEGTANSATNSDISAAPGTNASYFEWGTSMGTMRWATNTTVTLPTWIGGPAHTALAGTTTVFFTTFEDAGSGNYLTTTEGSGSVGDSGGPLFRVNGSNWELAGITLGVASATGQSAPVTGFGDLTFYASLGVHNGEIRLLMIPEPSAALLALLGMAFGLRRKR